MYTPHSLTWYQASIVNASTVYTRWEVPAVMWQEVKAANVNRAGFADADKFQVYVPMNHEGAVRELPFAVGDIIVKGIVTDEISGTFTAASLLKKYPSATKITSVDKKDYGLQSMWHWKLGGK